MTNGVWKSEKVVSIGIIGAFFALSILIGQVSRLNVAFADEFGQPEVKTDFSTCYGNKIERFLAVSNDGPTEIVEDEEFVALMNGNIDFKVRRRRNPAVAVIFSGRTRLTNASEDDWIEVEARLDGVPMKPEGLAFGSDHNWGMHSATFCQQVGPGHHTISVFWRLRDSFPFADLSGSLDDWTLLVFVSKR